MGHHGVRVPVRMPACACACDLCTGGRPLWHFRISGATLGWRASSAHEYLPFIPISGSCGWPCAFPLTKWRARCTPVLATTASRRSGMRAVLGRGPMQSMVSHLKVLAGQVCLAAGHPDSKRDDLHGALRHGALAADADQGLCAVRRHGRACARARRHCTLSSGKAPAACAACGCHPSRSGSVLSDVCIRTHWFAFCQFPRLSCTALTPK